MRHLSLLLARNNCNFNSLTSRRASGAVCLQDIERCCQDAAWDGDEYGDAALLAILGNHYAGDVEKMLSVIHGHARKTKLKAMRKFARSCQGATWIDEIASQAEQQDDAAYLVTEDLQNAGDNFSEAADQQPGVATRCASCNLLFESGEEPEMINGRPYHRDVCAKFAKPIAIATE